MSNPSEENDFQDEFAVTAEPDDENPDELAGEEVDDPTEEGDE